MVFGPQSSQSMNRVQPVDPDRQDDQQGRKRRVKYQGRDWAEQEEDLAVQPKLPEAPKPTLKAKKGAGVYADRVLLERAQALLQTLTTVEEKAAQLCFLVTDALYDMELQRNVELLIQTWQMGGILFQKGEYRRQAFLVERYQQLSKTPLLMANDFRHGLSFYLQGDPLPQAASLQHYTDLGKAVMAQNRRLGVHIQFDRERGAERLGMSEDQARAFRKGVRHDHGIVGKEKGQTQVKNFFPAEGISVFSIKDKLQKPSLFDQRTQETISFKSLTFFDATSTEETLLEEAILGAFKELCDVILLSTNLTAGIRAIVNLVNKGKLSEAALDRHVMRALILKSQFFK